MKSKLCGLLAALFMIPMHLFAQTVTGVVTDANSNEPLIGVNILIKGTTNGTVTDFDGKYSINALEYDVLVFSYLGYRTEEVTYENQPTINLKMRENSEQLEEVVVIGYGAVKKEDLTGSADLITSKDFNKGPLVSAQQLLNGKVAGVSITSGSGAPGDGQTINIRGLGSLSLTSSPLIVVDGVPLNDGSVAGSRNPLNLINPNDIESMTVLKDASATSIYGSRAANGVIMISTKKGSQRDFELNFNSSFTTRRPIDFIDVLDTAQFRNLVRQSGNEAAINLLGDSNTDWQDEIYEPAFGMDHTLSGIGNVMGLPMRASLGYSAHGGILKHDQFNRFTGSLSLTPSLLDDQLQVQLNLRGMKIDNQFANRGAIGSAVAFDPTQSVYDAESIFDGYYVWKQANNNYQINLAPTNPVAQLNLVDDFSDVKRFLGNVKLDYTLPFFPDITATTNIGYDQTLGTGETITSEFIPTSDQTWNGSLTSYEDKHTNKLFDAYLTYNKTLDARHNLNFVVGHSYQSFEFFKENYDSEDEEDGNTFITIDESKNVLLSYFGRLNYGFDGRYLITATLRADASSKLNPQDRWGYFPSIALAWNLHNESFMAFDNINELKLRLGYGEVGNVNGLGDYRFLTRYTGSQSTANYQFGNTYYQTYRPEPINENLRWEVGNTLNVGLDYALFDYRLTGSVNAYVKTTEDLIAFAFVDPLTNFGNRIDQNIGSMENKGIEFTINTVPIRTDKFEWNLNYNIAFNRNKVIDLPDQQFVGGIEGGTGNNIQTHIEGETPFSFLVFQQVYDEVGKPIEGAYVDRNADGLINDNDKYLYKDPFADVLMGINTDLTYDNFTLSVVTRANLGNYMYNNVATSGGYYDRLISTGNDYLANLHSSYLENGFQNITETNLLSDHFVTNASFFKIDLINLGYTVPLNTTAIGLSVFASAQNVATITKYKGLDPEIITGDDRGVDKNFYPRPRSFQVGFSLDF